MRLSTLHSPLPTLHSPLSTLHFPLLLFLLTFHLSPFTLQAQQTAVKLTLDSCIAQALRNQTEMKNALLDVSAARETKRAALTKYFPSLGLMAGYFRSANPLIDVSEGSGSDNLTVSATFDGRTLEQSEAELQQAFDQLGVDVDVAALLQSFADRIVIDARLQMLDHGAFANATLMQPIYAGGRIVNGNRLAQLGVQAAELRLIMTRNEVELNVCRLYWQIVSLQEKQAILHSVQQLLDTLERDASSAVEAGLMGRNDLLSVRLKQREADATATQLENGIRLATRALFQYMGTLPDSTVQYIFDMENEEQFSALHSPISPLSRPESRLLDLGVEAARLQQHMILGETLPQVAIGATYGANNLTTDQLRHNGLVFATVNIPVSAWWETAHNLRKQGIERAKAENTRRDLNEKLALQDYQLHLQLDEAYTLIGIRQQAVQDAQENLTEVRHYFDAGLVGMKDLLEAQTLLQQAQGALADQRIAHLLILREYQLNHRQSLHK